MTTRGGLYDEGVVFELPKNSTTITTLATFSGATGMYPGGVIIDGQGNLYGATGYGGGPNGTGGGTIWKLAKGSGTITVLASFPSNANIVNTLGMAADAQGDLYGTTMGGGATGQGTGWGLVKGSNSITTLASFGGTNGASPYGNVLLDAQGDLYGTEL